MVPAAVIIIGKSFGNARAARRTASYPAMLAMEESTSMLCARVMRGTSSSANSVAPVAAILAFSAVAVSGSPMPIKTWPGRRSSRSSWPSFDRVSAEGASLGDDLSFLEDLGPGGKGDTSAGIVVVRESGFKAGGKLGNDFESCFFQCFACAWGECNSAFRREKFLAAVRPLEAIQRASS